MQCASITDDQYDYFSRLDMFDWQYSDCLFSYLPFADMSNSVEELELDLLGGTEPLNEPLSLIDLFYSPDEEFA